MTTRYRRWLRRISFLVAVIFIVVVVVLRASNKINSDIQYAAALLAAVFGGYPVLFSAGDGSDGVRRNIDLDKLSGQLAVKIATQESNQKALLLNFASRPARAELAAASDLGSYEDSLQVGHCAWQNVFKEFWESTSRRLVILGDPGAGKTLLLLDLVSQSRSLLGKEAPLLIKVNVAQWRRSQTFEEFFTAQVSTERGVPAESIAALLREHRIIPMLDGLDELDAERAQKPERGLEIIRRLNSASLGEYPISAPLVVSCRSSYFKLLESFQLSENYGAVGLVGAGLLRIKSLSADQIADFLEKNLKSEAKRRWAEVLDDLRILERPPVVAVLGLPWRLILAFSAYQYGGSPNRLVGEPEDVAEAELLPQFLRNATQGKVQTGESTGAKNAFQRSWFQSFSQDPSRIARWLKEIAQFLEADRAAGGGAGVLLMYEVHKMVDVKIMRIVYGGCALGVVAVAGLATLVTGISGSHPFPRIVAIAVAVIFLVVAAYVAIFAPPSTPAGFTLAQAVRTPQGVFDLFVALVSALAASSFTLGTEDSLAYRVIGGACCGFMAGLFFGFVHSKRLRARAAGLQSSDTPNDPLHGGLFNSSIIGGLVGVIYTVILIVSGAGVRNAIFFGIVTFVFFAPILGLPIASIAWTRYKVSLFILFVQRRLPWRLSSFLVWSYDAGLMRTAGLAYQFRHLRMQTWLAETPADKLLSPSAADQAEV